MVFLFVGVEVLWFVSNLIDEFLVVYVCFVGCEMVFFLVFGEGGMVLNFVWIYCYCFFLGWVDGGIIGDEVFRVILCVRVG